MCVKFKNGKTVAVGEVQVGVGILLPFKLMLAYGSQKNNQYFFVFV
jgi:hypothetical protein